MCCVPKYQVAYCLFRRSMYFEVSRGAWGRGECVTRGEDLDARSKRCRDAFSRLFLKECTASACETIVWNARFLFSGGESSGMRRRMNLGMTSIDMGHIRESVLDYMPIHIQIPSSPPKHKWKTNVRLFYRQAMTSFLCVPIPSLNPFHNVNHHYKSSNPQAAHADPRERSTPSSSQTASISGAPS